MKDTDKKTLYKAYSEQVTNLENSLSNAKNATQRGHILLELGLICSFRKDYEKSIDYIEKAQKAFNEVKDIFNISICLSELALIHYKNCNDRLIRSLTLLNDSKYLIENIQDEKRTECEAKILHYYGIIYYFEKRYSDALKYFKLAQKTLNKKNLEYAKILDSLAIFYLRTNNYYVAVECMKEALLIKEKYNNLREISITEILLGRYFSNVENYTEAERYLLKGLDISEKLCDLHTLARMQGEIAKVYLELENSQLAEKYALKSVNLAKKLNLSVVAAFSSCILASVEVKNNKPSTALKILEQDVEPVFRTRSAPRGHGFAKQIRARINEKNDQNKEAIECLHEAVELYREADSNSEIARSYYELGMIYKKCLDYPMASSSLLEALSFAKHNNLHILSKKIEDLLFEVDEDEWANIIDKTAKKETFFTDGKSFIDTLTLIGDMTNTGASNKDPFLSLLRIGRSIAAETDLDKLLTIIAEETQKALSADRCTVFLLDRSSNELWSKVALGMGSQEIRFPANMGLAGHVALTGETINIKDAYNDSRFNKDIDKKTGYKTKTILCMPMRNLNHEIVGVFQVLNKFGNEHFSAEDEDLLIAIGSSTGIALENARLFKRQQVMYEEQKKSFVSFMNTLAASIDARDKITAGHANRVALYSIAIAEKMNLSRELIEVIEYSALLHDFGKIGIKDSVLCKEGSLTRDEYLHIQEHANITYQILKNMYFEEKFKDVPEIAATHHEKYDGTGYFRGLAGENIPLGGRILAVSDVFDAITSTRHYRDRMLFVNVLNILKNDTGTHFDKKVMNSFFSISLYKILSILLFKDQNSLINENHYYMKEITLGDFYNILCEKPESLDNKEKSLINDFETLYNPQNKKLIK